MTRIPTTLRLSVLAAGALLSASAFATTAGSADARLSPMPAPLPAQASTTVDVYAGGEAMAPEVQARLHAQTTGLATRAEVREQLADARSAGTLGGAGDLSDTQELMQARVAYNDLQATNILARYEAENQRLAALQQSSIVAQATPDAAVPPQGATPQEPALAGPAAGDVTTSDSLEPTTEQLIQDATAPAAPVEQPSDSAPQPSDQPVMEPEQPQGLKQDDAPLSSEPVQDELPLSNGPTQGEVPISGPVDSDTLQEPVDTQ